MTWPSFDVTAAEPRAARGFVLIGRAVRARRERLGVSQRELARRTGVHQSVISRLEADASVASDGRGSPA